MAANAPPSDDVDYFQSVPWAAALLAQPAVVPFTPISRLEGEMAVSSQTQDQLFRRSLNNDDTIPRCLGFYHDTARQVIDAIAKEDPPTSLRLLINSVSLFFDLQPGVNGFNGTAHGGLITSLMDEAMGSLLLVNSTVQATIQSEDKALPQGILNLANLRVLTAAMNVRFQKPVKTPGLVLVTATFVKTEKRKIFLDVRLRDEHGIENACCDGLWMALPRRKL
ncbi:hypothetical protein NKR23_g5380 [Pleurostoma richardsiae]|uniref:Thioesterase domain-containing protein n=1 Tax=Pleurostoma richardsiae TaxID=41990 RepID=A0AA38RFX4_9PEZI|nr:hypothetical protein NKR23_g5380 [Pleurostoma richardsiae]